MFLVKVLAAGRGKEALFFTELMDTREIKRLIIDRGAGAGLITVDNSAIEAVIQCIPWKTMDKELIRRKYTFTSFVKTAVPEIQAMLAQEPVMSLERVYKAFVPPEFHSKIALHKITLKGIGLPEFPLW